MSWIHTVLHLKWYLKNNAGANAKKKNQFPFAYTTQIQNLNFALTYYSSCLFALSLFVQ